MSGKKQLTSAIAHVKVDGVTIRGRDLCKDLIGRVGFTEYFYFLVTGQKASPDQIFFLDAVLVSLAEHGMVPNVQAARMTLAAAPEALQGAVCAGLLGAGSVVLGSAEAAGKVLSAMAAEVKKTGVSPDEIAVRTAQDYVKSGRRLPGFGHPIHKPDDPRAQRLLALADERGTAGIHVALARAMAKAADHAYGKHLVLNVSGAIPAVMLDLNFPAAAMKGIPLLARTAGLIGHLNEEMQNPIGFALGSVAEEAVAYSGEETTGA